MADLDKLAPVVLDILVYKLMLNVAKKVGPFQENSDEAFSSAKVLLKILKQFYPEDSIQAK